MTESPDAGGTPGLATVPPPSPSPHVEGSAKGEASMKTMLLAASVAALLASAGPAPAVDLDIDNPVHGMIVTAAVAEFCGIKRPRAFDSAASSIAFGEWGSGAESAIANIAFKVGAKMAILPADKRAEICKAAESAMKVGR